MADASAGVQDILAEVYHRESRSVLATLIRLLGDFDSAEEAMQEAFAVAVERWARDGVPQQPRAWLISTAHHKAIDRLRRRAAHEAVVAEHLARFAQEPDESTETPIADDRLRLIFTCCHPALAPDAQLALTLREVCGLTTEAIASAFLVRPSAIAQRIVRAKAKIRLAKIPYEVPSADELPERLAVVLRVLYLLFREGYAPSSGAAVTRSEVTAEAIRLGRLLQQLLPHPEVTGLLALMLLHDARGSARQSADGDVVLLSEQDRSHWNRARILEGGQLVEHALRQPGYGPYAVQAAIAAIHAEAPSAERTDWREIVGLYAVLYRLEPTPVIALNQAVAIAMLEGPAAGLERIAPLVDGGALAHYHLAHAARAELLRRLGQHASAQQAYATAMQYASNDAERRFLHSRLETLSR